MGCSGAKLVLDSSANARMGGNARYYRYNNSRHACMCSYLEDAKPANTKLKSIKRAIRCVNGFAATPDIMYPCFKVDLMSFVALQELNSVYGSPTDPTNDIWGWTDPDTCREIAILGLASGTAFVDVSDPVNYRYLGKLPHHDEYSEWRGIKTYKNHAFIISESVNHGMQVSVAFSSILF
jgi:hypothetical protein